MRMNKLLNQREKETVFQRLVNGVMISFSEDIIIGKIDFP